MYGVVVVSAGMEAGSLVGMLVERGIVGRGIGLGFTSVKGALCTNCCSNTVLCGAVEEMVEGVVVA